MPGVIIDKLNASLYRNHIDNRYIFCLPFPPFQSYSGQYEIKPPPDRCNYLQCGNMYQCELCFENIQIYEVVKVSKRRHGLKTAKTKLSMQVD